MIKAGKGKSFMTVDIDKIRADLIDYFGTAMTGGFPMAVVDLAKIETASAEEVVQIALKNGFDLNKYVISE